jgi:tryptophan synthase alpha chain
MPDDARDLKSPRSIEGLESRVESGAIEAAFARARAEGRAAFIPYVTAGDPDAPATGRILKALCEEGADIIELGVPFSDPLADGPVIQRASQRALAGGMTLRRTLDLAARIRGEIPAPIVLFTYANPIFRMGIEAFSDGCLASGVDGVLATDLPVEEASELRDALAGRGIRAIPLLAPTSGPDRIARAARPEAGFIYYISRTGVTGERNGLPADLEREVSAVRNASSLPVAVGFGISTPEQFRRVAAFADGVVVGSAIVHAVETAGADPAGAARRAARRLLGKEPVA